MRKTVTILLTAVLTLSMSTPAWAKDGELLAMI